MKISVIFPTKHYKIMWKIYSYGAKKLFSNLHNCSQSLAIDCMHPLWLPFNFYAWLICGIVQLYINFWYSFIVSWCVWFQIPLWCTETIKTSASVSIRLVRPSDFMETVLHVEVSNQCIPSEFKATLCWLPL